VVQLRALARRLGVSATGRKADLIGRITGYVDRGEPVYEMEERHVAATESVSEPESRASVPHSVPRERMLDEDEAGDSRPVSSIDGLLRTPGFGYA
jgi:hypothetical protein